MKDREADRDKHMEDNLPTCDLFKWTDTCKNTET